MSKHGAQNQGVWGNGASFDNVILANAYEALGRRAPWQFWQDRCFRTVKSMYPKLELARLGTYHNALDDAKWQTEYLLALHRQYATLEFNPSVIAA